MTYSDLREIDAKLSAAERDIFILDTQLQHAEMVAMGGLERVAVLRQIGALEVGEQGVDPA